MKKSCVMIPVDNVIYSIFCQVKKVTGVLCLLLTPNFGVMEKFHLEEW